MKIYVTTVTMVFHSDMICHNSCDMAAQLSILLGILPASVVVHRWGEHGVHRDSWSGTINSQANCKLRSASLILKIKYSQNNIGKNPEYVKTISKK